MKKQILPAILLLLLFILIFYQPIPSHASEHTPLWTHTFPRYEGGTEVVISANGHYFAVIGAYLYLFKYDKNVPLWRFDSPLENKNSVAMSADGQYIVLGTGGSLGGGHVYLFSKDSSTPLWISTINMGFLSVKITPDGQYIVAGGLQNITYLFDRRSPTPIMNYSVNYECISVAISATGQYIAVGTGDHTYWDEEIGALYLFSNSSSTPIWNYTIMDTPWSRTIKEVAISADGQYIVASGTNYRIYLLNQTGPSPSWNYYIGSIYAVSITSEGDYFAALGYNQVYLFNRTTLNSLWNYTFEGLGDFYGTYRTLAMSADGQYIAAARGNNTVIFNRTTATPLWNYISPYNTVGLDISADGQYTVLITYGEKSYGNTVYLFHLTDQGPMFLALDPLFLYILGVVGVFLACQFGLYHYLSRIGWEEKYKDRVIFATIPLCQGVLARIFMTGISVYDRTSYWVLSLYFYLFLIVGSILLILTLLKKLPISKDPGSSQAAMIGSIILAIIFSVAMLILQLVGYSMIWGFYMILFSWHHPIYYTWSYYKAKRKSLLNQALPFDPLKLTVSEI